VRWSTKRQSLHKSHIRRYLCTLARQSLRPVRYRRGGQCMRAHIRLPTLTRLSILEQLTTRRGSSIQDRYQKVFTPYEKPAVKPLMRPFSLVLRLARCKRGTSEQLPKTQNIRPFLRVAKPERNGIRSYSWAETESTKTPECKPVNNCVRSHNFPDLGCLIWKNGSRPQNAQPTCHE
jgi:hypothetical protein